MREQERYNLTMIAVEALYHLWELDHRQEERDLDQQFIVALSEDRRSRLYVC